MDQLNLTSARSAQEFVVTVKVGKTVIDLWTGKEIGRLPGVDFLGDFYCKDGLCTEDEIVEYLKTHLLAVHGLKWESAYEPCNDYRHLTLVNADKTLAYEFTICTADGILEHEEVCAEAEAKEIRKSWY